MREISVWCIADKHFSETEVQDFDDAFLGDLYVCWFQIAMNDVAFVCHFKCVNYLFCYWECFIKSDGSDAKSIRECWSFDQLHYQADLIGFMAVGFLEAVDGSNVRMVQ